MTFIPAWVPALRTDRPFMCHVPVKGSLTHPKLLPGLGGGALPRLPLADDPFKVGVGHGLAAGVLPLDLGGCNPFPLPLEKVCSL